MRIAYLSSLLLVLPFAAGCSSKAAENKDHGPGKAADAKEHATGKASNPLQAPKGLDNVELVPAENNELTLAKAELGKQLFFDPRLSNDGKMGCVNCHYPDKAFTDGIQFSTKDDGKKNSRNSPTVYNTGYYPDLYWDGRKHGLEANILAAWTGQLGGKPAEVASKLNGVAGYKEAFQKAFQKEADETTIVDALASFLRTLRSGNSKFDRGELSADAKAGQELFMGKGMCMTCHTPPLFTDRLFHNVGIGMQVDKPDLGRAGFTKNDSDRGKFKTPTLREIARTGPYFHDGSVDNLKAAVTLMANGGVDNDNLDPVLKAKKGMPELTEPEIEKLVAFLESLSGDVAWTAPELPK